MHSGPLLRLLHQVFLTAVGEHVAQPCHLGGLLRAHFDRLVAPIPDMVAPSTKAADLASEPRVQMIHEPSELLRTLGREQQVVMVGQEDAAMDSHSVEPLGSPEGSDDHFVELTTRPQEEPALSRPDRDLDQRTRGEIAKSSCHALVRGKTGPKSLAWGWNSQDGPLTLGLSIAELPSQRGCLSSRCQPLGQAEGARFADGRGELPAAALSSRWQLRRPTPG